MLYKIVLIIITINIALNIHSCTSCFGVNQEAIPYYNVNGYSSKSYRITGVNEHNMFEFVELDDNKAVEFDELAISIYASRDFHVTNPLPLSGNIAYACDPMPNGYMGTKEILDSLVIISSYDFNQDHPVGAKLNQYFNVYSAARDKGTLEQYLDQDSIQAPEGLGLLLNSGPTSSNLQKFKITFYLSTGEVFSTESRTVQIK